MSYAAGIQETQSRFGGGFRKAGEALGMTPLEVRRAEPSRAVNIGMETIASDRAFERKQELADLQFQQAERAAAAARSAQSGSMLGGIASSVLGLFL